MVCFNHEDNFEFQKIENSQNSFVLHALSDANGFSDVFNSDGLDLDFFPVGHLLSQCETEFTKKEHVF